MTEPRKVYNWPMGYCDNGGMHFGEHPLYTSSDGGCKNFVTSERLLEIKQLFDLTEFAKLFLNPEWESVTGSDGVHKYEECVYCYVRQPKDHNYWCSSVRAAEALGIKEKNENV